MSQAMAGTVAGAEGDAASEAHDGCTTNVVAMDGTGNAVSLIQSISAPYGSGIVAEGTGILLVEQNAQEALSASQRGYVLAMGENRLEGEAKSLLDNEEVGKLYLGT